MYCLPNETLEQNELHSEGSGKVANIQECRLEDQAMDRFPGKHNPTLLDDQLFGICPERKAASFRRQSIHN